MNTVQEPPNGHSSPSFFKSVIDDLTKIVIPSKQRKRGISPEPSPPRKVADPIRIGVPSDEPERGTSPRCQFTFSDGRRCRMQPSSLCVHHASKQESDPGPEGAPDTALGGLEALCGDLTTATNINRALAQVFLLLAQGRIPQKQAVAFGYLAQLLLQSLPAIRREVIDAFGSSVYDAKLRIRLGSSSRANNVSEGSLRDQGTSPVPPPVNKADQNDQSERGAPPALRTPLRRASPASSPHEAAEPSLSAPAGTPPPAAASAPSTNLPHPSASVRPAAAPPASASPTSTSLPQPPAAAASASPPPRPPAVSSELPAMRPSSPAPSPAAPVPGITLTRTGHTTDWFPPASWSKTRKPDPFPGRSNKFERKLRGMSSCRLRRLQHLQQSKSFLE